ncbi:MAG: Autotransporter-associated beta strand repeat-containing protein, partial [Bradyrhizobium sp.]|nr:Autotransporter-associated beta strand repeat-containing protein [Bradyrhizobium sp.]
QSIVLDPGAANQLTAITQAVDITGAGPGISITGTGAVAEGHGIFFIAAGAGNAVNISNLTLANGFARGGAAASAAGGGLGAGGAIFAMSGDITLTNVGFSGNQAQGGNGGGAGGSEGGGGGLNGGGGVNGGGFFSGGGGGGIGLGASGGGPGGGSGGTGILPGGSGGAGGAAFGFPGGPGGSGSGGGGGGLDEGAGGGGGFNGGAAAGFVGGAGGFGGGGGGGSYASGASRGGNGGFGGGGGGGFLSNGSGGFGGGGAGTTEGNPGAGGAFGGAGKGNAPEGGGGAGLGGSLFICTAAIDPSCGATLTINNTTGAGLTLDGATSGGNGYQLGQAVGGAIFLTTGAVANINVSAGSTTTISSDIGGGGTGGAGGDGGIAFAGGGTLVLGSANNTFSGISVSGAGSVLSVAAGGALGSGTVALADATTIRFTASSTHTNAMTVTGQTVFDTVSGSNVISESGVISGAGHIAVVGGGTLALSGANTFSLGTTICGTACGVAGGSSIVQIGVDTVGTPGAIISSAIGTGTLTFDGGTLQAGGNFTVANATQINSTGATIDANGLVFTHSGVIADTPGNVGRLTLNDSSGGYGTVVLSGNNTYSGGTTLASGIVNVGVDSVFNTPGDPSSGIVASAFGTGTLSFSGGWLQAGGNFTVANAAQIDSSTSIDANSYTFTYAGNISDAGATHAKLYLGGAAGTVILSGANTYSGGTNVSNISVQANNSNALGTGTVTLDGARFVAGANNLSISNNFAIEYFGTGSTFDNGGMTLTLSGVIADGAGFGPPPAVAFDGTGTTVLTGTNTYTGGTTICACTTLQLGDGGTTGSIVGNVVNDGTLAFNRSDSTSTPYVFAGVISGGGVVKQIGSGTVELSAANTYSGGTVISGGTVRVTNSDPGTSSSVGTGTVTLDGGRFQAGANNLDFSNTFEVNTTGGTIDTNGNTLTISGTIGDGNGATGVLTKSGAGTLVLTGSNSWSGGTALTAGTLSINHGDAIGTGDLAMAEGTALRLDGTFTLNNNINIAGDPIFDVTSGNTVNVAGVISDAPFPAPPGILEKIGGGTLVLSGANTYSGGTVISAGILEVTNNSSVGTGAVAMDGGTFRADGLSDLTFTNNFTVNTPGGTIDNNLTILTLSGDITNGSATPGLLTLTGGSGFGGTTVLSGNNSYSGGTAVLATTVQVTNANSLGTGAVTLDWGTIQTSGSDVTLSNNIVLADTINVGGITGGFLDANGARLTIAGNITGA